MGNRSLTCLPFCLLGRQLDENTSELDKLRSEVQILQAEVKDRESKLSNTEQNERKLMSTVSELKMSLLSSQGKVIWLSHDATDLNSGSFNQEKDKNTMASSVSLTSRLQSSRLKRKTNKMKMPPIRYHFFCRALLFIVDSDVSVSAPYQGSRDPPPSRSARRGVKTAPTRGF